MRTLKKEDIIMSTINTIALILAIIGGLNWGSIGIFQYDIVASVFGGQSSVMSRIIYTLVGIAAVWCISLLFKDEEPVDTKNRYERED